MNPFEEPAQTGHFQYGQGVSFVKGIRHNENPGRDKGAIAPTHWDSRHSQNPRAALQYARFTDK